MYGIGAMRKCWNARDWSWIHSADSVIPVAQIYFFCRFRRCLHVLYMYIYKN